MGADSDSYYYVLGLSESRGAGQKARKLYIKSILNLYKMHPFHMLIFYGANWLLPAGINMAKPFVPFKVQVVNNLDSALKQIAEEMSKDRHSSNLVPINNSERNKGRPDQIHAYVKELLN